ncbi:hypothetical protein [Iamia sp.]|uniref:hypothetical protein n=1 Tax=Iamia sp. TaxID=2722710 RepID=UPI002CD927DB|nr:hypothetical protein [Iamia sp.]HXH59080.1 hypothetical protein [Iamia sp.]
MTTLRPLWSWLDDVEARYIRGLTDDDLVAAGTYTRYAQGCIDDADIDHLLSSTEVDSLRRRTGRELLWHDLDMASYLDQDRSDATDVAVLTARDIVDAKLGSDQWRAARRRLLRLARSGEVEWPDGTTQAPPDEKSKARLFWALLHDHYEQAAPST